MCRTNDKIVFLIALSGMLSIASIASALDTSDLEPTQRLLLRMADFALDRFSVKAEGNWGDEPDQGTSDDTLMIRRVPLGRMPLHVGRKTTSNDPAGASALAATSSAASSTAAEQTREWPASEPQSTPDSSRWAQPPSTSAGQAAIEPAGTELDSADVIFGEGFVENHLVELPDTNALSVYQPYQRQVAPGRTPVPQAMPNGGQSHATGVGPQSEASGVTAPANGPIKQQFRRRFR